MQKGFAKLLEVQNHDLLQAIICIIWFRKVRKTHLFLNSSRGENQAMFAKETLVFLPSQGNKIQQQMFEKLRAIALLGVLCDTN